MEALALRAGRIASPSFRSLSRPASDDRLVAALRCGDTEAFEEIYDRYQRQLLSFCRHMLGSREEAEDALQQTFISAHEGILRSDKPIHLRAWLFTIARNQCLSVLRARREHSSIDDVEPAVEGLAPAIQRREDLRDLLRDLGRLPDDQRTALLLAELGALSHEEIGEVVGCSKEKVKALVFQARSSLIAGREARDTPCEEIREQLATLSGGALRRASLRKHLRDCPGCRDFQTQVKRQRQDLALLLPVVPTAALKAGVMSGAAAKSAAAGGAAGTGASGAGAGIGASAAGAGAGTSAGLSGLATTLANVGATKLLVAGAIGLAGAGGTVASVEVATTSHGHHSGASSSGTSGTGAGSSTRATPSGVTPTRAHRDQAPGKQTSGVANRKSAKGDHGRSGVSPGHSGTAPGLAGTAPGRVSKTPARSKSGGGSRGKSGSAPGHTRAPRARGHSNSANRGASGNRGGNSGSAPRHSGSGNSGNAPGADAGNSGNTSVHVPAAPALPRTGTAGEPS